MDKMSQGDWKRLGAVRRVKQATLTVVQAAQMLGVSERQIRRLAAAIAAYPDAVDRDARCALRERRRTPF
jgi:hypothetical protein